MIKKGRITIPTDESFVEGTKKYIERWGADAVRDCDGTELPKNANELADKVYKTYFIARGDNDFAYKSDEFMQNIAIISERFTAFDTRLEIDLLKGIFDEQVRPNDTNYKKYWQVYDRTTNEEIPVSDWEYIGNNIVVVHNAKKMHEYTVNYFGYNLWDATQVYNYTCNGWTKTKDRDYDPIYPEVLEHILNGLDDWLKANPHVNVVRFTTFFYHFFILYKTGSSQKLFDWYNYAMSASPKMFERFYEEYGYEVKLEDLITEGYYSNQFLIPSKAKSDYYEMVERFVSRTCRKIIDKVHEYGKEAMMFWGDNWVGIEPYGKYFSEVGLDAIVGSVSSGTTCRAVSDLTGLKYTEIRLMPYFFPDSLWDDKEATKSLLYNWTIERRAILRKPVDRIGFGGYLSIADKLPTFCDGVERVCNEFREIYDTVNKKNPYSPVKVAILSYWGKEKSWMTWMVSQDAPFARTAQYLGILESLAGLPVDIEFISFEDAKNGKLKDYDVVINGGEPGTTFSGGECWKDAELVACVREYIANGGGFIGLGNPSAVMHGGRFFQLADALGVEKEMSFSVLFNKFNCKIHKHFITEDLEGEIDYGGATDYVYALEGTKILAATAPNGWVGVNNCHVKMAANEYGKGRCFYLAGMRYNAVNTRMVYRALLWCAGKEHLLERAYSSNLNTECHYYPESKRYALVNNTAEPQNTVFYDINGNAKDYSLTANEIIWIDEI